MRALTTTPRWLIWMQLGVVATSASILSFSSLRDLGGMCGFSSQLSWLLPLVVDAGAAAGCAVWLGGHAATPAARRWARGLTVTLLIASVLGNAVIHYLNAYAMRPAWWLVVVVSAVAPAVLGAVLHLAVLVARGAEPVAEPATRPAAEAEATEPQLQDLEQLAANLEKRCEQCGDGFVDTSANGSGRYCSSSCRQTAYRERKKQEAAEKKQAALAAA